MAPVRSGSHLQQWVSVYLVKQAKSGDQEEVQRFIPPLKKK
jgi:hypothetical protein